MFLNNFLKWQERQIFFFFFIFEFHRKNIHDLTKFGDWISLELNFQVFCDL